MVLKDILKDLEITNLKGDVSEDIASITNNSKNATEGSLFICVPGFKHDGHAYIQEAIHNGAKAIVVQKKVDIDGIIVIEVKDTRKAMHKIAQNFYRYPSNQLKLVGVTGTNGKTTVTYLLESIFSCARKNTGVIGTIAVRANGNEIESSRTTPESLDLQGYFKKMSDDSVEYVVMEVSSHALDLGRVDGCNFETGIFTNLTQDHLDFHKDFDNYRRAKTKLFYNTKKANVINIDDEHGRIIAGEISNLETRLITYAIKNNADVMAKDIEILADGVRFTAITPEYSIQVKYNTPGLFSVYNCLAAISAAYAEGIQKDAIIQGLSSLNGVPGRSEVVKIDKPYTVVIDYAHTPDGLENILNSVKQYAKGKIITVFGCGGERDAGKRPLMGKIAGSISDFCVITSDNPRSEEPASIIAAIEQGIVDTKCPYICIEDRKSAIEHALSTANGGDVVLITGKGHEKSQILMDGTIDFDEKKIVREFAQ